MSTRSLSVRITIVALVFSLGPVLAQSFDTHTRTVSVEPSGTDDTLAIATAFDICLALGDLEASTVIVRDSRVEASMALEIANVSSSLIELRGNELSGAEPGVVAQMVSQGRSLPGPTTLVMSENTVRVGTGDRSVGVLLWDEGTPPSQHAFVSGNRFELDGSLAAVHGYADAAVVRDNVITGTAVSGIRVGGNSPFSGGGVARPWLVVDNDVSELGPAPSEASPSSSRTTRAGAWWPVRGPPRCAMAVRSPS